jgi:NRPS condensation-like uncharacterized protein
MTAKAVPRSDLRPQPAQPQPSRPRTAEPRTAEPRPFAVGDEINCYFNSAAEPNNVHLEAWLPGRLDPECLRAAVAGALTDLPRAAARRVQATSWRTRDTWEFPAKPDRDPVAVVPWRTADELNAIRGQFLSTVPDLDISPAFTLLIAQGPGWDSLIFNAHHALFDGRSSLHLLELIAARYSALAVSGRPAADPADLTGPEPALGGGRPPAGRPAAAGRRAGRHAAPRLAGWRTARIAGQRAGGQATALPGYRTSLLDWPGIPASPQRPGQPRVTVNDLLIAALAETVNRWNSARIQRPAYIRITMPMDTRSSGHDEMGNLSRLTTIIVDPRRSTALAEAVAGQTRLAKDDPAPLVRPVQSTIARARLPIPVKRSLVRLALRWFGNVVCDTSLLSNLGRISAPPAFGDLVPARMWFSGPAHMPRGLFVGAVSVGGRLQLCFRYRRALLDEAAGDAFAAEFAATLAALSAAVAPPRSPSRAENSAESRVGR